MKGRVGTMLIFGNRYTFLENELAVMQKKFGEIHHVNYKDYTEEETLQYMAQLIEEKNIRFILLNTKAKVPNSVIAFLTKMELKGIRFMTLEVFMETYLYKCYIDYENNDLSYLQNIHKYTLFQRFQKKCIDLFGLFWLFFFSWPVMLKSYLKIKKESPGPVFYIQPRVGMHAKEFNCVKFRSMRVDAEKDGIKFASKDDDRIFPWGAEMRRKRYDELPQMYNILKGEMHLIGPRPERKYWVDKFEKSIPYYNERHLVKPGITGWAQVMYSYGENEEDARQKLMYDLYYIKNWNILLELKIVWLTAMTVIHKKGI